MDCIYLQLHDSRKEIKMHVKWFSRFCLYALFDRVLDDASSLGP